MPTRATAPRKKYPAKYLYSDSRYPNTDYFIVAKSESAALDGAAADLNCGRADVSIVGIYKLIKVVRRQFAPVEIENLESEKEK